MTKIKQEKKRGRGAPEKQDKIELNGLRKDQNIQLKDLSDLTGLSIAFLKREAVDWYLDARENGKITGSNGGEAAKEM